MAQNTLVLVDQLQKETIRLKDKKTIIKQAANTQYEGEVKQQGDTVRVQTFPDIFGNVGGTAGGAISTPAFAIKSETLTTDQVYQNGSQIADIEEVQSNLSLISKVANRFAYASANQEDQYVASFFSDAPTANKIANQSPLTLSSSNTYSDCVTQLTKALSENNATGGYFFGSPAFTRRLKLEGILDSSDRGLDIRLNGVMGRIDGFQYMETNNLPHVRTLTVDDTLTGSDTMTIQGLEQDTVNGGYKARNVVFTFVASPSSAGDIDIGATVADTQANIVNAINGTGTTGASTYIELAAADRTALKNAFVYCSAFSSDVATIRSSFNMTVAETFTAGTNVFGVDAILVAALDRQAINFACQMDKYKVKDLTDRFGSNVLLEKVYGGKVFDENGKGMATCEVIA